MIFIDGHPICDKCLSGNHEHPLTKKAREQRRSDCKNVGVIDGIEYQCHCGYGGWCKEKKWEPWAEEP